MESIRTQMFGRLQVQIGDELITNKFAPKIQMLICYLFLFRDKEHSRDLLACNLWEDKSTSQAKRSLRQLLFQLQNAFQQLEQSGEAILVIEPEWISVNVEAKLWLDVWEFEDIYTQLNTVPIEKLTSEQAQLLQYAVDLYKADLLEGWYQDWCIWAREHFQRMYLAMLDKLMHYYELIENYKLGVQYGLRILKYDQAHERTHRRLMHIYNLGGDRTAALRQYEACCIALEEELGVPPADSTVALYEKICGEQHNLTPDRAYKTTLSTQHLRLDEPISAVNLKRIYMSLMNLKYEIDSCIKDFEEDLV